MKNEKLKASKSGLVVGAESCSAISFGRRGVGVNFITSKYLLPVYATKLTPTPEAACR